MKHINSFKLYNLKSINENLSDTTMSYGPGDEEHRRFCQDASEWSEKTGKNIVWCFYINPNHINRVEAAKEKGFSIGGGYDIKRVQGFWNLYVKGDSTLEVVEVGDKLVAYIKTGENISHGPFDNIDLPFDISMIKMNEAFEKTDIEWEKSTGNKLIKSVQRKTDPDGSFGVFLNDIKDKAKGDLVAYFKNGKERRMSYLMNLKDKLEEASPKKPETIKLLDEIKVALDEALKK